MQTLEDIPFDLLCKLYDSLTHVTEDMEDAGIAHNHGHNAPSNMVKSYQEMLVYAPVFKRLFGEP
jgi:hypothetical protein